MMLFHGSYAAIEKPDLSFSRDKVDFGKGFYTTPFKEQAKWWAERFKKDTGHGVFSIYNFDESAFSQIKILEFETYSEAWLDFIAVCRRGADKTDFDLVIGGVANDKVFNTLTLYFRTMISKDEALKRLMYDKPNSQYCFRTQSVIDRYLKFVKSEEI
ncbi:hypothetical protein AGMMS50229_02530 [Campylobacterota bacterium]|nr:hypothetical protein AGMMS50229_02530 [Campylobacterota bacterium]